MYYLKAAQSELYRYRAGYSRDIDSIIHFVSELEAVHSRNMADFLEDISAISCSDCHREGRTMADLKKVADRTHLLLHGYKEKISRIVTLRRLELTRPVEEEAVRDGEELLQIINTLQNVASQINEQEGALLRAAVRRSVYSVIAAIILSMLLSSLIIMRVIRSITVPLQKLVRGIEDVSAGEYTAKVDVGTADEFAFLAGEFNDMTENLLWITRRKDELLLEVRELNDNLEKRIREATDELRNTQELMVRNQTLSVVGTFASGIAHELATPLSSIINYFGMIREKLISQGEPAEEVEIIEAELLRCRTILRGILTFARTPEKEKAPTDVNAIIREILLLVTYKTGYKRKISMREELAPDLPLIKAVSGQLRQVFMNIIINAAESMPEGGEIRVSTSAEAGSGNILVRVSDTGCGIPEGEVDKICSPFYTSKPSGTGLGLSISYGIIKVHGGDISLQSEAGKGTTFTITLPVGDSKQ